MRLAAVTGTALLGALLLPVALIGVVLGGITAVVPASDVDQSAIPPAAAAHLGLIATLTASTCPDLPPVWVVAHVQAESSWNPTAFSTDPNGGAAGYLQINQANWQDAGGAPWPSVPPQPGADVLDPVQHLRLAIPWVCRNLRAMTAHLQETGKPTSPLDAMLVCHIAGCGRVTGSATGIPRVGEAGCNQRCADLVTRYLARVHELVAAYRRSGPVPVDDLPNPAAFTGTSTRCAEPDPTGGSCLTPATRYMHDQVTAVFGPPRPGNPIISATCWDPHPQNPRSDHSRGRACDYFPGPPGRYAAGHTLAVGWRVAGWLRAHAAELHIAYIIWQGRFWAPGSPDTDGWGRPYTGGGIYDPDDATGGHFDHVHVSVAT